MNNAWMKLLLALTTVAIIAVAGENEGLGFQDMTSGLNAVPRIGRRSVFNPFDRYGSGFRFVRDRRWPGWPGLHHFRFRDDSQTGAMVDDPRHKREGGEESDINKRGPSPSPHPLPRPYATVKTDQQAFWEDVVSEAARNSIMQKLAQAAYNKAQAASTPRLDYGSSPLARFLSRYGGSPNQPPGIYNDESS